jgi:hypothetical protein
MSIRPLLRDWADPVMAVRGSGGLPIEPDLL